MREGKWRCKKCGSDAIQAQAWVDPNTNEVFEILGTKAKGDPHYAWCADCEEKADLVQDGEEES